MSIHWGWSPWLAMPLCLAVRRGLRGGVRHAITARFRHPTVHRHAGHDGLRPGTGQDRLRRHENLDRREEPDGTYRYVDVPHVFRSIDVANPWAATSRW